MRKVIKLVLTVVLSFGAVAMISSASADPGTSGGGGAKACSSC